MFDRRRSLAWIVLAVAGLIGCGDGKPPRVKFGGKVTDGGKPLSIPNGGMAQISFIPLFDDPTKPGKRDPASSLIIEDGSYKIIGTDSTGIYPGKYRVTIKVMRTIDSDLLKGKFDETNSKIEREVTLSTSSFDFDISKAEG